MAPKVHSVLGSIMTGESIQTLIRKKAMDLLARREHSERELQRKLIARDYEHEDVAGVMRQLQQDGLQSDERFAESYVNSRYNAGVGPLKIRYELHQKGISDMLADEMLAAFTDQWDQLMTQQRMRKFGKSIPTDYNERMKQARFLQNKGFSPESVMRLFR